MTISSVGSSSYAENTTDNTAQLRELEKQISKVQAEISTVQNDDSLDADTKSQRVTAYQTQLQQLQAQQSQLRTAQAGGGASAAKQVEQAVREQETPSGMFGIGQFLDEQA